MKMEFFNSLSLDLKMVVIGIAGCTLLALFSGNAKAEKRYVLVLALLSIAGVYRFTHSPVAVDPAETRLAASRASQAVTPAPRHVPLVSTSAK
jgi:hypothetical protein